jgi:hypothetical protein
MSRPTRFSLETIKQLDSGVVDAAFKTEMEHVVRDCTDRPLLDKPREVTIKFLVLPKVKADGRTNDCDAVEVEVHVGSKIPGRKSPVYSMGVKQDGSLTFHPDAPEDHDADLLIDPDVIDRERKGGNHDGR